MLLCDGRQTIERLCSGEGEYGRADRDAIVRQAVKLAEQYGVKLIVTMEEWSLHGKWSNVAKMNVCEEAGRWKDSLIQYGVISRLQRVQVNVWHREELQSKNRLKGPQWKKLAIKHARAHCDMRSENENEAEALCMTRWGLFAPDSCDLLGTARPFA